MEDFLSAAAAACKILSALVIHAPDQLCNDAQLQLH